MDWSWALKTCRSLGGTLAEPKSQQENELLQKWLSRCGASFHTRIGIRDPERFRQ